MPIAGLPLRHVPSLWRRGSLLVILLAGCYPKPATTPPSPKTEAHTAELKSSEPPSTAKTAEVAAPSQPVQVTPLFRDWPKPTVALVITGQQLGYIEPCGCSGLENQKGGLARRHTFIKQLSE